MSYPYILQGDNLIIVIGNKSHTINRTHLAYNRLVDAVKAQDWEAVKELVEAKKIVTNYCQGNVTIEGEKLLWRGKEMHSTLASKIIQMFQEGFPVEPMINFMVNLMDNPSNRAVTELYGFLEKGNLPITPDGHFMAYKKVRDNYYDVHSGTMDNSVGKVVSMARNQVNDDREVECGEGLHFCSISYLQQFGGARTMILKINPMDVVSIPKDYYSAKGRTCRYEVIGELEGEPEKAFTKSVQTNSVNNNGTLPTQQGWPFPKKPVGPKTGSTPFYCGYTDGFTGRSSAPSKFGWIEQQNYLEGFDKGSADSDQDAPERYRYV